jgi:hypothetical protein
MRSPMKPEGYSTKNRKRPKRAKRPPKPQPTKRVKVRKRIKGDEAGFGRKRFRSRSMKVLRSWVILLCVVSGLALWGYRTWRARYPDPTPVVSPKEAGEGEMPALDGPIRWEGPAPQEVAQRFMEAKTVEERLGLIRNPLQMCDVLKQFFTEGPGKDEKPARLTPLEEVASDDKMVTRFALAMEDGSMRLVSLPFTEDGRALVDFKAYSRFCSHPWSEVLAGNVPSAPEMRVFLARGAYYNHEFADESRWISFVASSPDLDEPIFLYANREDANTPAELRNWPADSSAPIRCTIALETMGASHLKRQFVLKKMLRAGWLDP